MEKIVVAKHKDSVIKKFNSMLDCLINSDVDKNIKKASLLSYWIKDYTDYLIKESSFDPKQGIKYKRGDIVKINLGFNIGNEEGGLHYCVVLDNNSPISSGTITVIPLSSYKKDKKIHFTSVLLGNTIYSSLLDKGKAIIDSSNEYKKKLKSLDMLNPDAVSNIAMLNREYNEKILFTNKILLEIEKMKYGSIALVNQITTISKLRIYNPKSSYDILYNIKLTPKEMDLINIKIQELYIFHKKSDNIGQVKENEISIKIEEFIRIEEIIKVEELEEAKMT